MSGWKRCAKGDEFILATWSVVYGPDILESSNQIESLCKEIPKYLVQEEDEELYLCKVGYWTAYNGQFFSHLDSEPHEIETICIVKPRETDLLVEEEEEEEATV